MLKENKALLSPKALENKILEEYPSLSKRLREVAHYLLDNQSDIAVKTAAAIAEDAQVPASALIRFAQQFGFSGFSDIQELYKTQLLSTTNTENMAAAPGSCKYTLESITNAHSHNMQQLIEGITEDTLQQAITQISKANTVYVSGEGHALPVASYLSLLLQQKGQFAHVLNQATDLWEQQLKLITPDDVLIAFDYDTTHHLRNIHFCKAPIILISDSKLSVNTKDADVVLTVQEAKIDNTYSLAASMGLAQTLALLLKQKNSKN